MVGSFVATKPPTVSEWPPRYFVVECTTMSAPSSSGCWRYGVANVLSTTRIAPTSCAASAAARMSTTFSSGFDGDLDPDDARVVVEMVAQVREVLRRDVVEQVALGLVHLRRHAVDAAVDVGDQHDALSRVDEMHERRRRAEPRRERDAVVGVLERGERLLERGAGRVRDARVVVALVLADGVLDVGRRLVDRRDDRAGRRIRLLPLVDRAGLEVHARKSTNARPARRRGRGRAVRRPHRGRRRGSRGRRAPDGSALTRSVLSARSCFRSARPTSRSRREERQDVVAVDPLGLAFVDLDHVPEAEDALEKGAIPDEVVERGEEHAPAARGRPARRPPGRAPAPCRPRPSSSRSSPSATSASACGRSAAAPPRRRHISRDGRFGERAACAHAAERRPADVLVARRRRPFRSSAGTTRSGRS